MSRPTMIKITDGIYLNLNSVASVGIGRDMQLTKLKEGVVKGKTPEDYVTYNADCVCFHYAAGNSLYFRVGMEMTNEDYERVEQELAFLQFKLYERKPSTVKDTAPAT